MIVSQLIAMKTEYSLEQEAQLPQRDRAMRAMLVNSYYVSRGMGVKNFKQQKWPSRLLNGTGNKAIR